MPGAPSPRPQKTLPSARTRAAFAPSGRADGRGASVILAADLETQVATGPRQNAPLAGRGATRRRIGLEAGDRARPTFRQALLRANFARLGENRRSSMLREQFSEALKQAMRDKETLA